MFYDPPTKSEVRVAARLGVVLPNKYGFSCDGCQIADNWSVGWFEPAAAREYVEHIVAYKRVSLCLSCRAQYCISSPRRCCCLQM